MALELETAAETRLSKLLILAVRLYLCRALPVVLLISRLLGDGVGRSLTMSEGHRLVVAACLQFEPTTPRSSPEPLLVVLPMPSHRLPYPRRRIPRLLGRRGKLGPFLLHGMLPDHGISPGTIKAALSTRIRKTTSDRTALIYMFACFHARNEHL